MDCRDDTGRLNETKVKVAKSLSGEVHTFCEASLAQCPQFVINDVGGGVDKSLLVVDAAALNMVI